jgi:hypothetical protein
MQKSHAGLLLSELFESLDAQHDLILVVFAEEYRTKNFHFQGFACYPELKGALEKVITETELPVSLFLLIDGLDEYDTNATGGRIGIEIAEIADQFNSLAENPRVKMLLSSRPLPAFQKALDEKPKLRLEDHTSKDIHILVTDKLSEHSVGSRGKARRCKGCPQFEV